MSHPNHHFDSNAFFQSRRRALRTIAGTAAGVATLSVTLPLAKGLFAAELKGHMNHSVCLWCYNDYLKQSKISLDEFAAACAALGLKSVELTDPEQWPTLKKHGLICAMAKSHSIPKGLNHIANHSECLALIRKRIDQAAEAGYPNVICFSGNRAGMSDDEGLANSILALKKVASYAEQKKITICLEFLNTHDHKDYMASSTKWCVGLVQGVASPRVKVLYDIYHAGMMKEDVMADIRDHNDCWGHYHTGGVPGRHEIDSTQTQDYAAICEAIVKTGFKGYIAQEFIPKRPEAIKSLEQAVGICDV
jgi:hydroxypyruvate isomerase